MEIRYGQKYRNKTSRFLLPCLIEGHNPVFSMKLNDTLILGCGLGDMALSQNPDFIFLEKSPIYVLLDRIAVKRKTEDFIYWLKYQDDIFLGDYPLDLRGRAHMVIIDLPEKYYNAYDKFMEGKYSEMFTEEEIERLFDKESHEYKVLTRDRSILPQFAVQLQELFEMRELSPMDIKDSELELPYTMNKEEEFFNYTELPQ